MNIDTPQNGRIFHGQGVLVIGLKICDVRVSIYCEPETLSQKIAEQYQFYCYDFGDPDYVVDLLWVAPDTLSRSGSESLGNIDLTFDKGCYVVSTSSYDGKIDPLTREGKLVLRSKNPILDIEYFMRLVVAYGIYERGGFLLHSSGIVRKKKAYLFFGKSGSGKSTVSRLSGGEIILSDEMVGVLPTDKGVLAYSTPFWNPGWPIQRQYSAEIAGIFRLVQDHSVFITPIRSSQAVSEILASIPVIPTNAEMCKSLIPIIETIRRRVGVYYLHFTKDNGFWNIVDQVT